MFLSCGYKCNTYKNSNTDLSNICVFDCLFVCFVLSSSSYLKRAAVALHFEYIILPRFGVVDFQVFRMILLPS